MREPTRSPPDWPQVVAFLPIFESAAIQFGTWQGPHVMFDPAVNRFVRTLYAAKVVQPFDWPAWTEEASALTSDPEQLDGADLEDLQNLLTFHVRRDRFVEGHLLAMLEQGNITRILRRLDDLINAAA